MSYYLATITSIADWIKGLASGNSVYFPAKHGQSSYRFTRVQSESEIQFEHYTPTVVPPVKLLLPAREELLQFRKNADGKSEVSASLDTSFRILAGVRSCDLKGNLSDGSFLQGWISGRVLSRAPGKHRRYRIRLRDSVRSARFLRGGGISRPHGRRRCFCDSARERGCHGRGQNGAREKTDGVALAGNACDKDPRGEKPASAEKPKQFGRPLAAAAKDLPRIVASKYQSPVWEKHVTRCFSCGTCNLVCPTCYCFDVADDLNLDAVSGNRTRTWDACMLPQFAVVTGGHNFRPEPASRQRHRINRKFEYLPENISTDRSAWDAGVAAARYYPHRYLRYCLGSDHRRRSMMSPVSAE